jgi:hypothetical protein
MRNAIIILLCSLFGLSCNNTQNNDQDPLVVLNSTVNFEMIDSVRLINNFLTWSDFRKKYRNVSIVYLQDGCARYLGITTSGRELAPSLRSGPRFSAADYVVGRYSVFGKTAWLTGEG